MVPVLSGIAFTSGLLLVGKRICYLTKARFTRSDDDPPHACS
jgi:hypothetical protein